MMRVQDLSKFKLPVGFRGRSPYFVQIWWIVQATLFGLSPQFCYSWRRWLIRLFGAKIGKDVLIRPTARITFPWKVTIGDHSWIGDNVVLYSLGRIEIGKNAVISQNSYLCAADHDYRNIEFPINKNPIKICNEAWIAADVFIAPGITIEEGAVVGARSSVFSDLPSMTVCWGTPARPVKPRENNMNGQRENGNFD